MNRAVFTIIAAAIAGALSAGCYGGKLIKMPINAEHSSVRADSLAARQLRVLRLLDVVQKQINEEREARIRYQAQSGLTLSELEETIRILASQLEDNSQLRWNQRGARDESQTIATPGENVALPDSSAGTDSTTTIPPQVTGAQAADQLYRASYMDLTRGNYDLAVQGFKNYLVRHPAGAHLPEVHYYLGECYYAGDRFLEAVGGFQYVVREFPESRLAPAAYLKSGLCYGRLEEKNLAERAYRELIEKFPGTEEAQQARDLLEQFGG